MKFAESTYNKIWDSREGRDIVMMILQNPDMIRANFTFWREKFRVDPNVTPTDADGKATFSSYMRQMEMGTLMDMRAPLADSIPEDVKGIQYYSGSIPEYISKGTVETVPQREYKKKLFAQFGDSALIAAYATDVLQNKIDSANQTLSHMAAQLLSTGKLIYKQGQGAQNSILKAAIPTENFITAGEKVWTDPSAMILNQMTKIEQDFKEKWGLDMQFQWEITRDTFLQCFLPNKQVQEWIQYTNTINNTPLPATFVATEDMAKTAIAKFPMLSPIVIVEEKQKDVTNGIVHGWADGVAVLRPVGYAGLVRHTNILDEEFFTAENVNPNNTYSFASALDGLAVVRNSVIANGNFKEWHTDLILPAVPTLDEFLYHVIVNIKQADA